MSATQTLLQKLSAKLKLDEKKIGACVALLEGGDTIPFISRYRKEVTGYLDETQITDIATLYEKEKKLETRKGEVLEALIEKGVLNDSLKVAITQSEKLSELEAIYAPYKTKRKTRAMVATEKGLKPLAQKLITATAKEIASAAAALVNLHPADPEKNCSNIEEVLAGAIDIVAEDLSKNPKIRTAVRTVFEKTAAISIKGKKEKEKSTYGMYYDFNAPLGSLKSHHVLAILRGERDKELSYKIECDEKVAGQVIERDLKPTNSYYVNAIEDSVHRLIVPSLENEYVTDIKERAFQESIRIFTTNLESILLARPVPASVVLAIDPGIRTGSKGAVIDKDGKYLDSFTFYSAGHKAEMASELQKGYDFIAKAVEHYKVNLIAVGNGTGTHEAQQIVLTALKNKNLDVPMTIVNEDGASVYSASKVAVEELGQLDVSIRGAVSLGRRLQDPMAELVKIDPASLGVGLYQHDIPTAMLSEGLDLCVQSAVNRVGVFLNSASPSILKYVSGITPTLAKKIVTYRESHGAFKKREELLAVPGLGPKAFEQCAGFLRIPGGLDVLDNTWIHPESYSVARKVYPFVKEKKIGTAEIQTLAKECKVTSRMLEELVQELTRPGRDPREDYPMPHFVKGLLTFEDIKEGMELHGTIRNVTNFGAFVDIGIKESALLHISQMSDTFVKDPLTVVKAGESVTCRVLSIDYERKRIAVTRKSR